MSNFAEDRLALLLAGGQGLLQADLRRTQGLDQSFRCLVVLIVVSSGSDMARQAHYRRRVNRRRAKDRQKHTLRRIMLISVQWTQQREPIERSIAARTISSRSLCFAGTL